MERPLYIKTSWQSGPRARERIHPHQLSPIGWGQSSGGPVSALYVYVNEFNPINGEDPSSDGVARRAYEAQLAK